MTAFLIVFMVINTFGALNSANHLGWRSAALLFVALDAYQLGVSR